jgi:hypothetical protein
MVIKIYAFIWLLLIASSGFLFIIRGFSEMTLTILGFALSTLVFAGIIAVLPWWVDERYTWKYRY